MIVASTSSSTTLSSLLAKNLMCGTANITRKRFPDGEMYVRVNDSVDGQTVVFVSSIRTDSDFLESLLILEALGGRRADRIIAVIPYFGYARQHLRYLEGEPISSYVIGRSILDYAEIAFSVEIHDDSALAPFSGRIKNINTSSVFADYLRAFNLDFIISPDDGGRSRADSIARLLNCGSMNLDKIRIDPTRTEISKPDEDISGKRAVIVDDIISTGGTIINASRILKSSGVSWLSIAAVHGIFLNQSAEKIMQNASDVAVSNTIDTPYSKIDVSPVISEYIKGEI
ncbi:MAG: ribose-phosphate diphosphokinase [Candidatus Thermoplasmatota archaeon]|nr:ribose-phosphate diphosphokinase [Candidatus Thermoplasmatota archaeon]MCL5730619.1 ribose-phosphate diphosphokinase [Candidatus Thermoplasmatota archaeon]